MIGRLKQIHQSHYDIHQVRHYEKTYLVLFIILLVITSQLALTLYLPSMPAMVTYFQTNIKHIQFSIPIYLLAYGLSQFIYGPLSDIYGRRWIILIGLCLFILGSLICLSAWTIHFFLVGRLLQGLGIGCGDTMGRAILCDRFKDEAFVKAASIIGLAATVTPMLGPVFGGYIQTYANWSTNFLIIFIYGVIAISLVFFFLPETKSVALPVVYTVKEVLNTYLFVIKNPIFLTFFIPGMVSFLGETIFNMMSPFLLQNQLSWNPIEYGWLNILTIFGLICGSIIAHIVSKYVTYQKMVCYGMYILCGSALLMLLLVLTFSMNTFCILFPMTLFMVGVGITYPNTNMGALSPFTTIAGTAGALQGGLQMLSAGILGQLVSGVSLKTQFPLAIILSILSLAGLSIFIVLFYSGNKK